MGYCSGMDELALDTSVRQHERYFQLLRDLTPAQRLRIVSSASRRMRAMAEAGVRMRAPTLSDREVQERVVELLYGADALARIRNKLR